MVVTKTSQSRLGSVDFNDLGFGRIFSDHMFMSSYENGSWNSPRIVPFGNIDISPGLSALHYGQAVFDGLKAYWSADGKIALFRPDQYCERLNKSCARLCIPRVDPDFFMDAVVQLCTDRRGVGAAQEGLLPLHQAVHLRYGQSPWRARLQIIPLHDHYVAGRGLL